MRKQLWKARLMGKHPESVNSAKSQLVDSAVEKENAAQEKGEFQLVNTPHTGRLFVSEGVERMDMNCAGSKEMNSGCSIGDGKMFTHDMVCTSSSCSSFSMSEEEWVSERLPRSPVCTDGSLSDDDSLIEIAIPDGHYIKTDESKALFQPNTEGAFLSGFLPDSVFRQDGLMELLTEINEDDSLIEIDIAIGSIKCSGLGIKA